MIITYNNWGFEFLDFRFEGNDGFSLIQGMERINFRDFTEVKEFLRIFTITMRGITVSNALSCNYGKIMKVSRVNRRPKEMITLEYGSGVLYFYQSEIRPFTTVIKKLMKNWGKYGGRIRSGRLSNGYRFLMHG